MSEIREVYINDQVYPNITYVTEWLNVSSSVSLTFTVFEDNNCDIVLDWAIDNNYNIINTETTPLIGGNSVTIYTPVKNRFVRLSVLNIAVQPSVLEVQGFHYVTSGLGLAHLENVGGFVELFVEPSSLRTLQSSNSSIIVTQNSDNIDLLNNGVISLDHNVPPFANSYSIVKSAIPASGNVILNWLTDDNTDGGVIWTENVSGYLTGKATLPTVTLNSSGGSISLVNDGTGPSLSVVGLTPGSGVSLVNSGTAVTINSSFTQSGPADRSGTLQNVFGGNFIMGNIYTDPVSFSGCSDSSILASAGSSLTGGLANAIVACSGSNITQGIASNLRNFIGASQNSNIISSATYAATNCVVLGGSLTFNATAGVCRNSGALACDSSNFTAGDTSAQIASQLGTISNPGKQNLMLSTSQCTISGTTDHNIVLGKSVTASGGYSFSCNLASGSTLTTTTNGRWTVKAPGAVYYYSNSGETTGVFLAASSSSWSAVSLRSAKENIIELNYDDVLNKFDQMGIYSYNYKDCDPCRKSYGPMADDVDGFYQTVFPVENIQVLKKDNEGNNMLDESGDPIVETVPAKDINSIETNDRIGVLEACVKALLNRVKQQEEKIKELQARVL